MASKLPNSGTYPVHHIPSYDHNGIFDPPVSSTARGINGHPHPFRVNSYDVELPPRRPKRSFNLPALVDPRRWGKWTRIIVGVVVVVILIIIIVPAAVLTVKKNNRYPDYTPLEYSLKSTFNPNNFYENFDFWTDPDPAKGFVQYDSAREAAQLNLTYSDPTSALLRVDDTLPNQTKGRHSVRIASTQTYNSGLFLFDIRHSPTGCATWPAVWLCDSYNWPQNGEIDIIEAVNRGVLGSSATLHTSKGCKMDVKRKQTGKQLKTDCYNSTAANAGCGVQGAPATYGPEFNKNGGGVFATEWRAAGIRIWFFPRADMPSDVADAVDGDRETLVGGPDPSTWGEALADFPSTECDITSHFRNASIVANIDLCGPWAGSKKVYESQSKCPGDCREFVKNRPEEFGDAYWEFGAFRVYQAGGEA